MLPCPRYTSARTVKNGSIHNGKQSHKCKDCERQFVEAPQNKIISQETKELIDMLLLEKLPLAGIARVAEVSEPWRATSARSTKRSQSESRASRKRGTSERLMRRDVVVCGLGRCKKWVWLALNTATREIIGVFVGSRGKSGAKGLWRLLPSVYRQCAVIHTDFWKAYAEVLPNKRHKSVDKSSSKTSHIERFNGTLRQRVSRLVRKTLSFSRKLDNHVGAIWTFVHHYNASLPL